MVRKIAVVGAGVVGSALARELSGVPNLDVTVIERSSESALSGSTEYAPGFIGLYNDEPILTGLARDSANVYDSIGIGFRRTGGIEVATSVRGAEELERRASSAQTAGLMVKKLDADDAAALAPTVIDPTQVVSAWSYPMDGSGEPSTLTAALRNEAVTRGARFLYDSPVTGIERVGRRVRITAVGTDELFDDVVLTSGVWGPSLTALVGVDLPLFPVAHPYVYSPSNPHHSTGPFARWPEHHVYARVHGDRLGLGTYDHVPLPINQDRLDAGANLAWLNDPFDTAVDKAMRLLPETSSFLPELRINGVFAMTPDNLPLVGTFNSLPGLWSAQAIWVTHAAGTAKALAAAMTEGAPLPHELDPARFTGTPKEDLEASALRLYRDIYANDAK